MLSRGGVAPRVIQAALRHASPEFSMRAYVDPKLLDVADALRALPDHPLGATAAHSLPGPAPTGRRTGS
jgi:hypothetical protein